MVCSKKALLAAVAGVFLIDGIAAGPASAQLYFRPFFAPFAYAYSYDYPEHDEAPARYASRRAVASILAREGYRLVGPLGRHGEQIVATGYSRRGGDMRFLVDPYEGRIIRGTRIAPPDDATGPRRDDEPEYVLPLGGSRPVVRDISRDRDTPSASRPRRERSARLREAPDREWVTIDGQERAAAPRRITPETPAKPAAAEPARRPGPKTIEAKPAEPRAPEPKPHLVKQEPLAAKPLEDRPADTKPPRIVYPVPAPKTEPATVAAKPASKSAKPESAKTESAKAEGAKAEPNTTIVAKPAPAVSTPASAREAAPTPKTAASSGGSSHRAIVPPTTGPAAPASTDGTN